MDVQSLPVPENFLHAWISYKSERGFGDFLDFEDYMSTYNGFIYHYFLNVTLD